MMRAGGSWKRSALAAGAISSLLCTAAWRWPGDIGVTYDVHVTERVIDPGGRRSERVLLVGRTSTQGARARVDISTGSDEIRAGDYLLTTDGGHTLTIVSPEARTYTVFTPGEVAARLARELKGRTRVSDGWIEVDSLDAEGKFTAERRRISRAFQMTLRVMLVRRVVLQVQETSDYTIDPGMTSVSNPVMTYLTAVAAAPARLDSTLGARLTSVEESLGGVLATRWEHRSVTREGSRSSETTTVMQTTGVAREPMRGDSFIIPAGFTKRALP